MALFRVSNERAQFDAAGNDARDQYGAGIRFTQGGNARVTTGSATNYNQGIPMSGTGQVAIVDATAGLPAGTIFHNGLPISGDKVCVSRNATAVVSNGLPYDAAGAVAGDINLDLNFIGTDTLNSSVTFTRASTATYFNSAGVLTSAAINESRFDYNPATLAAQGLLIEEQRSNSFLYSAQFDDATWVKTNSSVAANVTTSPDGAATADKFIPNNGITGANLGGQSISFTASTSYTMSVFVKAAELTSITLLMTTGTAGFGSGNNVAATFDLATGTVSNIERPGTTASIQAIRNGWYRLVLTATPTLTHSFSSQVLRYNSTGDGTSGLFAWGAQIEAGAFPTSYIPTTTTALTRSADVASVNTLAPWFNSTASTLYAEWTNIAAAIPTGVQQNITEIADPSGNNFYRLFQLQGAGAKASTNMFSGGVNPGRLDSGGAYSNATVKAASAFAASDRAISANGAVATASATGALPVGVTALFLGHQVGGFSFLNGYLRRVTYYPRRLSNAELQAITA